jgi:hypothetical protein
MIWPMESVLETNKLCDASNIRLNDSFLSRYFIDEKKLG